MTVKELKEQLRDVPDHYRVCYECDTLDKVVDVRAQEIYVSRIRESIIVLSDRELT